MTPQRHSRPANKLGRAPLPGIFLAVAMHGACAADGHRPQAVTSMTPAAPGVATEGPRATKKGAPGPFSASVAELEIELPATCRKVASSADPEVSARRPRMSDQAVGALEKGIGLIRLGSHVAAIREIERAYDLSNDPAALQWLMLAQKELLRYAAWLDSLLAYIENGSLSAAERAHACNVAADGAQLVGAIRIFPEEAKATVRVNGQEVGKTPLRRAIHVDAEETIEVKIEKEGFETFVWTGKVQAGREVRLDPPLVRKAREGWLAIQGDPGGQVGIDGVAMGQTPWEGRVPAGPHLLTVTAALKVPYSLDITLPESGHRTVTASLAPAVPTWVWALGATVLTGAAALGVGFLFERQAVNSTIEPALIDLSGKEPK